MYSRTAWIFLVPHVEDEAVVGQVLVAVQAGRAVGHLDDDMLALRHDEAGLEVVGAPCPVVKRPLSTAK